MARLLLTFVFCDLVSRERRTDRGSELVQPIFIQVCATFYL
jgi:hypothetical protein